MGGDGAGEARHALAADAPLEAAHSAQDVGAPPHFGRRLALDALGALGRAQARAGTHDVRDPVGARQGIDQIYIPAKIFARASSYCRCCKTCGLSSILPYN